MAFFVYTLNPPFGLGLRDLVGAGITGTVVRLDAVVQYVPPHRQAMLEREIKVYERLQRDHKDSPRILRYHGSLEQGLVLAYACHGTLREYLHSHQEGIPLPLRLRWIEQMVEGVTVLHSSGVLHGDISCNNFLLDANLDVKCCHFAGSSIDGEEALTCYETFPEY
ncbi:kinase-like protein [Teratosphaeria nubilosa]|uniref:EKC/KEOPS complex subunit BUD32 n=1 Tax=Teratosphaeria nubilosa TaxID=161662 RepID=A0A6G1L0M1_9PEZI|nr:kinase-like protein [Teratosphaeria nubilosa]